MSTTLLPEVIILVILLVIQATVYPFVNKIIDNLNIAKHIRTQREKARKQREQQIRDIVDEHLKQMLNDEE